MVIEGGHRRLETYAWRHHNAELEAVGSNPSKHPRSNNRIIKKESATGKVYGSTILTKIGSGQVEIRTGSKFYLDFEIKDTGPNVQGKKLGKIRTFVDFP